MLTDLFKRQNFFFIGIAGTGMSAIAQYLNYIGKTVSGSDRCFAQPEDDIKHKLEAQGIKCSPQDGSGLDENIEIVVVSTAIEKNVDEYQKAIKLAIKIVHRADILQAIANTKKTIAVAGTSGKSTTVAMIYKILNYNNLAPSMISGAGLIELEKQNLLGNAVADEGQWLIMEADESDGSLTKYFPEIGILLNIDKDHKELKELDQIFTRFATNVRELLIVNHANKNAARYTQNIEHDICLNDGFYATDFEQKSFQVTFKVKDIDFSLPLPGYHNVENALAAISVANYIGVSLEKCAEALSKFEGIYRRLQKIAQKDGVIIVDDYAHNPAKISAAIKAMQNISNNIIAWFQPHGFAPTKFLKEDLQNSIAKVLRETDQIWMSEIFYAGGTADKTISANDLIKEIQLKNKNAYFCENRNELPQMIAPHLKEDTVILLMGARDISLQNFAKYVADNILYSKRV